ncbi:uncharacterized protein LOC115245684 [Formica exsecta]|uniref:uncharacterized protein LOC115245684 n=1 Tax=Formica exsecta TaxID=72781 RepID=UPI0011438F32|nr:uncharacterized protein LOC115245684 [Formica exsecta]
MSAYDELTAHIQGLLDMREKIKKGAKGPPSKPPPSRAVPSDADRQYVVPSMGPVPAKDGAGKKGKRKGNSQKGGNPLGDPGKDGPKPIMAKVQTKSPSPNNPPPLPRPSDAQDSAWVKVVGRKKARKSRAPVPAPAKPSSKSSSGAKKSPLLGYREGQGKGCPRRYCEEVWEEPQDGGGDYSLPGRLIRRDNCPCLPKEAGLPANHRAGGESCHAKKGGRAAKKGGRQIEKKGRAKGGLGDGVASPEPSQGKQGEEKGGAKGGSGDGLATPGLAQGQVKEAPKPQRRRRERGASKQDEDRRRRASSSNQRAYGGDHGGGLSVANYGEANRPPPGKSKPLRQGPGSFPTYPGAVEMRNRDRG